MAQSYQTAKLKVRIILPKIHEDRPKSELSNNYWQWMGWKWVSGECSPSVLASPTACVTDREYAKPRPQFLQNPPHKLPLFQMFLT